MESKSVEQKLIDAVRWGNLVEVLLAIKAGASVLTKDEYGNDVVLVAAGLHHWLVVDVLLRCGANVEAKTVGGGNHLIHFAAAEGNWLAVCRLMHSKVSLNSLNSFGETPLELALWGGHTRVAEFLEQNGARAKAELHHIKDILDNVAATYTTQHFGEKYACLCNHGLSLHTIDTGHCDGVIRHPNGDEELCTCDTFADVWGREIPVYQPEFREVFGDYDLAPF